MPYTLAKAFVWMALAGVLGLAVGWLLRSVAARRQVARARSQHGDPDELARLRTSEAELASVSAERDRLRDERDRLAAQLHASERDAPPRRPDEGDPSADTGAVEPPPTSSPMVGDDAEQAALGHDAKPDDLTVIEGIGPSIEELCHGIGIRTWADMAATESSLLRTMLTDAGPRFKMYDPTTWPQQATLLAEGRWDEFRELTDHIRDGVGGR